MNKKVLVLSAAVLFTMSGINFVHAEDDSVDSLKSKGCIEADKPAQFGQRSDCDKIQDTTPSPHEFKGHSNKHHPKKHFQGRYPSPEEMKAKRIEFENRLKLTDEQKKQIEVQKQVDREKIKPIMEQIKVKKQEFKTVIDDKSLSQVDKDVKLKEIKESLKELKAQAESLRKENMTNFENLLTDKQKKEFNKIKEEQKKEMEQRRKQFDKKMKKQRK